jgi:hypothetical protein
LCEELEAGCAYLGEQGAEGAAAVRELPFLFGGELGEGEAEGGDEEERVIAEAVSTARSVEDFSCDDALSAEEDLAVTGKGERADKAGGAVWVFIEALEEQRVVAFVFGARFVEASVVSVAGGADTGFVVEGRDFEAGVIGEDERIGLTERVGAGLELGIAHEGGCVLNGLGDFFEAWKRKHADVLRARRGGELAELAWVGGSCIEGHKTVIRG